MGVLLAQSYEQLVNRARFHESLGYFLAILSFAILFGGVAWSVGKRFRGKARVRFTATALGVLVLLVAAAAVGLTVAFKRSSPSGARKTSSAISQQLPAAPRTDTLIVYVGADRKITVGESTMPRSQFVALLEQATTKWGQQGIKLENVSAEFRCDPTVPYGELIELMHSCQEMGIIQLSMRSENWE